MMCRNVFIVIVLQFFVCSVCTNSTENSTLLMVHVLFRHGERTTEHFYPNDPYINNTFYPIGKGDLTNRGKLQEYNLGKFLRQRYGNLIGDVYTSDVMQVRSTGFLRTRKSAQLVVAGLWPPSPDQIWNDHLLWLPIPVDYKPYEEDDLLNPGACARRLQLLYQQRNDENVKKVFIAPHKDLMKYIEEKSGKPMSSPADALEMFLILNTEEDTNLTLPSWTKSIYPEKLYEVASKAYKYFNFNSELRKINAGYFFKKITDDFETLNTITNKYYTKLYLYSGHESTLGHILDILKLKPHISPYGSAVMFEYHKSSEDEFFIKILYRKGLGSSAEIQEIIFPGCEEKCSLNTFKDLLEDILPTISYKDACKIKDE